MNDYTDDELRRKGWLWKVRSYDAGGNFCVETVHKSQHSLDMELEAIDRLGRTAEVRRLAPTSGETLIVVRPPSEDTP